MLIKTPFKSDREKREIIPAEMESFPCICRWTDLDWYEDKTIPWHWHTELEINCVESGCLQFQIPEQTITAGKGEVVFVNSGVLHTCHPVGKEPCHYYTHIFDMHFLSGMYNSLFEEKYFLPVSRNSALQLWLVKPDSLEHIEMISTEMKAIELCKQEPDGFEFDLRTRLCDFWRLLLKDTAAIRATARQRGNADTERMKAMMGFIHEHYGEKISLDDIAESASISTRECSRCFRRCIDSSPNDYLNQYRIRAAVRLLTESDMTILEISEECGFSSASYFTKIFRDTMRCTPKGYRDTNR